jgi:hypothetical protein
MKDEDLCIEWYFYKYLATPVDDKVVNPLTGRLFQNLVDSKKLDRKCASCDEFRLNPLVNPFTGKLYGATYRKLLKQCPAKYFGTGMLKRLRRYNYELYRTIYNHLPLF